MANKSIGEKQEFLRNAVAKGLASQETFIGAALAFGAYFSGQAISEVDEKIEKTKEQRREINEKIRHAGEVGKKVQGLIMLALSVVTLNPEELELNEVIGHSGELAEKGVDEPGLLGTLIEDMASAKLQPKLDKIDAQMRSLLSLKQGVTQTRDDQDYQSKVANLKGSLDRLKTDVKEAALYARMLSDEMRTPPQRPRRPGKGKGTHPTAEAAAAAADGKIRQSGWKF